MPENPYESPKEVSDARPSRRWRVPWLAVGLMCGIVPAFFLLPCASDSTGRIQTVIIVVSLLGGLSFGFFLDIVSKPQK
jgi:hypothetical protein